ncbi:MAG: radical SAM protein [Ignavibacteriaceae bacterium]|nr:radical SAM protein [Ignavibacteriaceae bacterium]
MPAHKVFPWFIHSLAANLSTACPAGCTHCLWKARQERIALHHTVMTQSQMQRLVAFGKSFGIKEVVASGGEPFSRPEALQTLSVLCSRNLMGLHAITSAIWADTPQTARTMLEKTGPWSRLAVSIDDFHQESIPLKNCLHVLDASTAMGIPVTIASIDGADDVIQELPDKTRNEVPIVSQPLMGTRFMQWDELDAPCINMSVPYCEEGDAIYGCCGDLCEMRNESPLFFGRTDELPQKGIAEDRIRLVKYLRLFGPVSLYRELTGEIPDGTSPFTSQCALCTSIFTLPQASEKTTRFLNREQTLARLALAEAVLFSNTREQVSALNLKPS